MVPVCRAVSFDVGQTLAELDTAFLEERLAERGVVVAASALEAATPTAYAQYDRLSTHAGHPWVAFMSTLLEEVDVDPVAAQRHAESLFVDQPTRNLWRRPVPGMFDLCRELSGAGVPVGVISNSEGHVATLLDQMGLEGVFRVVADSGRLGIEKPDRRIFDWFVERIGVPHAEIVHIGDSPTADVDGAIGAGMHAIWFDPGVRHGSIVRPGVPRATNAEEVRRALAAIGLRAY
jgi:putative hydrolase of the HAD superfamily